MHRASGPLAFTAALALAMFVAPAPLMAQRRSMPSPSPFPDDDISLSPTRGRSMSISGVVADAGSHVRMEGVRVDLQGPAGSVLATAFTTTNGNFQFNNIRSGSYELLFQQTGYQDDREHLNIDAPVFGMTVQLRRLEDGGTPGRASVSVRELSIPRKAREAMSKGMDLFYHKSDYPGSIKQFERAIQAYPDYYEAYALIGMAYIKMKDAGQAEQALRKSIDLSHENYADAFALLSALYSSEKRFADAEPLARKAVEVNANSWHAQSELAQALLGLNRADEAESYAQAAARLAPGNPTMCLLLADVHIALRNDPALLEDLNSYLKLAPDGPYADKVREQREHVQQRLQNSQASPAPSPSDPHANP